MGETTSSKYRIWASALLSVVPLWVGTYFVYRPVADLPAVTAMSLIIMYCALLMALLAGAKWGVVSTGKVSRFAATQMALSVVFVFAALVAIIMPPVVGLSIELAGFVVLGFWDLLHTQSAIIEFWFARLRIWTTVLIVSPLVALLVKVL